MENIGNIKAININDHSLLNFISAVCRKIHVDKVIDKYTTSSNGRKPDIPYGTLGIMLISLISDGYNPLHMLEEFFITENVDLEGVYKYDFLNSKITDDRFALFLDKFYEAGPQRIFSELSTNAILEYGIKVKNINFDTTSKVMWGSYETPEGKLGSINIDFGHSKQKRSDKKQIKMGLGVANGLIVDAQVMSGNEDDKTYNSNKIKELDDILKRTNTVKEEFYYIADSAAFCENTIKTMNDNNLKFITRMPENTKVSKVLIKNAIDNLKDLEEVKIPNAKNKEIVYYLKKVITDYKGNQLNTCICYSTALEETKKISIEKHSDKELKELASTLKKYKNREFACLEDAEKEIKEINKIKVVKKLKYSNINLTIRKEEKRGPGRRSKDSSNISYKYFIDTEISKNQYKIDEALKLACVFILASNDLSISDKEMLAEYKTQSSVENKFKQLKSNYFVDSLFLKTPERVEALSYIILITLMILSLIEYVVRREMAKEDATIIGPARLKMKRPTLLSIKRLMSWLGYTVIELTDGRKYRNLGKKFREAHEKILGYLGLDKSIFIG